MLTGKSIYQSKKSMKSTTQTVLNNRNKENV